MPSEDDVQATYQIAKALQFVDVTLMDHVVVADGDFVSMVHSKHFLPMGLTESLNEAIL